MVLTSIQSKKLPHHEVEILVLHDFGQLFCLARHETYENAETMEMAVPLPIQAPINTSVG